MFYVSNYSGFTFEILTWPIENYFSDLAIYVTGSEDHITIMEYQTVCSLWLINV